jgi:hypothetical protein
MNPTITNSRLERERRLDPLRFQREYEAEFTDDLSACFEYGALQACVDGGVHERPPVPRVQYRAFFDPASGEKKGNDAVTLGIAIGTTAVQCWMSCGRGRHRSRRAR